MVGEFRGRFRVGSVQVASFRADRGAGSRFGPGSGGGSASIHFVSNNLVVETALWSNRASEFYFIASSGAGSVWVRCRLRVSGRTAVRVRVLGQVLEVVRRQAPVIWSSMPSSLNPKIVLLLQFGFQPARFGKHWKRI